MNDAWKQSPLVVKIRGERVAKSDEIHHNLPEIRTLVIEAAI